MGGRINSRLPILEIFYAGLLCVFFRSIPFIYIVCINFQYLQHKIRIWAASLPWTRPRSCWKSVWCVLQAWAKSVEGRTRHSRCQQVSHKIWQTVARRCHPRGSIECLYIFPCICVHPCLRVYIGILVCIFNFRIQSSERARFQS